MGKDSFQYQNLNSDKSRVGELSSQHEASTKKPLEDYLQQKPEIFLLNNILMSVQFFDNYERDLEVLRENWYKEFELETHHKVCFYADSLFRLIGINVKFKPHYGIDKGLECLLHPLRIFIANDNVEAVFDPGLFGKRKTDISPYYRLTVKPSDDNKKDKSGYVSLVEFRPIERFQSPNLKRQTMPEEQTNPKETFHRNIAVNLKRKSTFDLKNSRTLTKTEKLIGLQNKSLTKPDRRSSIRSFEVSSEEPIPQNGFYEYEQPKTRLKERSIHDFRMNEMPENSHRIPKKCFQSVDIKKKLENRRRSALRKDETGGLFTTKNYLNSAAYKGYFCDLIVENLSESLNLDPESMDGGMVQEEFVIFKQKNTQIYITPVIKIQDWNQHVDICKKQRTLKPKDIEWPTVQMNKILRLLPCYAVPKGYTLEHEENLDYEKEWKLCFLKAEEFLILHVMHAHLRCYLFVLAIYKSFIEPEVDRTSFGPEHLLHLLFWRIHKDFLAWPEDRPGETLIYFLQDLYKKLRNKSLPDFFITSRNLFSGSLAKDLHKAQALIKKIIENPVPHVLRAVRNLHLDSRFYPAFDVLKLNNAFKIVETKDKKTKKSDRKPEQKKVTFADEEREWKKEVIKQIHLEKKEEEERKVSVKSIDTETFLHFEHVNPPQCREIVEMFIIHFFEMGTRSADQKFLTQALTYATQIQKLIELLLARDPKKDVKDIKRDLSSLKEKCEKLRRNYRAQNTKQILLGNRNTSKESDVDAPATTAHTDKETVKILMRESNIEEEECETKL